ncbi:TetR/AcrR family transcriptional regulator [Spiractinospora alimapuensis]|uniref:TetR/AcrR family transcriptional regulator n=1 Tax=Spiractinospora alimapuensis TaxID=2820884 RepID=UPI001F18DBB1|nr:TetR/AcrR family transcriptional regulator [Spiractinospora alimapuensis]QVQ51282.1 TetR/AcrR family transcriptional regulator [Spiractinospora alimapuensis]
MSQTDRTEPSKPALRADAERNRRLIMDAAHEAFADEGLGVSLTEIARRAGVGFATLQRRFPTKDALVTEVVRAQLAHIREGTARSATSDPWTAFTTPILDCCAHQVKDPGLAGPLAHLLSAASEPMVREPLLDAFEPLAARAIAEGVVRKDLTIDDVLLILKGNAGVIANSPGEETEASQRFVEIALRGLRSETPN